MNITITLDEDTHDFVRIACANYAAAFARKRYMSPGQESRARAMADLNERVAGACALGKSNAQYEFAQQLAALKEALREEGAK